jgi:uncharacterized protein YyaL (SSP411 family)
MSGIDWLPWSAAAFARAKAERKPVLLSIVTTWSRGCDEMDRTSYADSAVAGLIAERFVPIRVDADRRPDISSRYTLGGWPTTAFLNAGGEILGGGTFVGVDRLPSVLQRVVDAIDGAAGDTAAPGHGHIRGIGQESGNGGYDVRGEGTVAVDDIEAAVFDTYDAHDGTFGGVPRFPHPAPIHLALAHARADRDSPYAEIATTCLDAMGWGGLYDEVDGGFFRYANESDWTRPQSEKLLDVNASLLVLYLDGFETLNLARYAERAADVLGYVQQTLADVQDGGWAASQQEAPEYYELADASARAVRPAPPVDSTLLSAPNATMVSAALRAARVFGDDGLRTFALRSLERVVLRHYRPGGGVAHCIEGDQEVRGLVDDQIAMASAHLDAYDVTGDIVYEMMAEELARQAVIACRDERGGGFFDRASDAHDVGLLRHPLKPFVVNCEAARMLRRLAAVSGENEFAGLADETLRAVAAQAAAQGPLAAHYVLAVREAGVK